MSELFMALGGGRCETTGFSRRRPGPAAIRVTGSVWANLRLPAHASETWPMIAVGHQRAPLSAVHGQVGLVTSM
jgi:hypothetical protein